MFNVYLGKVQVIHLKQKNELTGLCPLFILDAVSTTIRAIHNQSCLRPRMNVKKVTLVCVIRLNVLVLLMTGC